MTGATRRTAIEDVAPLRIHWVEEIVIVFAVFQLFEGLLSPATLAAILARCVELR